jgi:hypothetical protein
MRASRHHLRRRLRRLVLNVYFNDSCGTHSRKTHYILAEFDRKTVTREALAGLVSAQIKQDFADIAESITEVFVYVEQVHSGKTLGCLSLKPRKSLSV